MRRIYRDKETTFLGFHPLTFIIGSVSVLLVVGLAVIVYNNTDKISESKL